MKRDLYALHDVEPQSAFKVTEKSAKSWNEKGYGIFWTVNEFAGKRKSLNLKRLNSWYVEIDELDKATQLALIEASPVYPNLIIESKRSFHLYWNCRDASVERYGEVLAGIRHFFGGDEKAKDIARLLRAPGYLHMKDPADPFLVQKTWEFEGEYSERLMRYNFPCPPDEDEKSDEPPRAFKEIKVYGDQFWDRIYNLDCEEALMRLSGTSYVNGETYSFRSVGGGKKNILVNGKSTSCWIDAAKRIGSSSKGGPTVWMWLRYFGHSHKETYQIIKDVFPEVVR